MFVLIDREAKSSFLLLTGSGENNLSDSCFFGAEIKIKGKSRSLKTGLYPLETSAVCKQQLIGKRVGHVLLGRGIPSEFKTTPLLKMITATIIIYRVKSVILPALYK